MILLHQSSLRRQLITVIMLGVGLALVLAVVAFLGIEVHGYRTAAQRELDLLARVVGESSSAALEFKDPAEGKRLLANLRAHRHIVSAALLDRSGQIFATYRREGEGPVPEALGRSQPGHAFENGQLWLATPVIHDGERLGAIYLRVDMAELNGRLKWVLAGGVVLTLLIGSAAFLLALRMGRVVSEPILHLTDAARGIAAGKDPDLRVARERGDEVGVLVDAFNHMLDQLQERQARLQEAQHLAHLGNWAFDPTHQESDWSEETYHIFGLDPSKGVPDNAAFRALIHPEDLAAMDAGIARGLGADGRFELDHRILRPDGSLGWIHASGVRFEGRHGQPVLRGTVMDITERKQTEAALLQGQKLESLGVLAGGIAHDFNNLLAALQGFLEIARLELPPGSTTVVQLDRAERVIQRASDLVRQMLAYSGKAKFQVAPLDLSSVVREMAHLLSVSISKKAKMRYAIGEGLPWMVGDPAQIQQVVMNLVINASDALSVEGGTIQVGTRLEVLDAERIAAGFPGQEMDPGPYVVMEVTDDGHGMDAATLARIFDPFFTTKFAGRGLGLAAMLGIVRAHRGGIQVQSEVGKGTTFQVYFPASLVMASEAKGPQEAVGFQGAGRVLVVDDESEVRASTSAMFEWMGFQVLQAQDGLAGLDVVQEHKGDLRLVVLDYTMPRMDGEACFRAIQALDPQLPVLLTSGFSQGASIGALLEDGLAGFLAKPYSLSMLSAKVQEILR